MAQQETDLEHGIVGRDDWQRRWDEGDTGFQKPVHNPRLEKYEAKMFDGKHKQIFAPLSGKSPDLLWFYNKGHTIIGVDIIELPCKCFFEENNMEFTVEDVSIGKLYKSKDGRLQLYAANLFDLSVELLGKCDIIWDCSSLCAVNVQDHQQYLDLMVSLMKPDTQIYLNVREYDASVWPGPPHSITEECVWDMYGSCCTVEVLEKSDTASIDSFIRPTDGDAATKLAAKKSKAAQAIRTSSYVYHYCYLITLKSEQ